MALKSRVDTLRIARRVHKDMRFQSLEALCSIIP